MGTVLGSPVVRVGFVTQLLWDRYGSFWRDLVAGAGAEAALPEPAAVKQAFEQLPAEAAPTASFRLAQTIGVDPLWHQQLLEMRDERQRLEELDRVFRAALE